MGWSFDLRTAVLFGALVILLTAALLLLSWRSLRGNVRPSLRWWLAALLLHPVGLSLACMHDMAPTWLSVPLGDTALALALGCMAISLRVFYGMPERRLALSGITAMVGVSAVWFTFVMPNLQGRIVVRELLLAGLLASAARAVFRPGGPRGRVPRLTGSLFAVATGLMVARALHEVLWPITWSQVMEPTYVNLLCLGALVVLPMLATVSFLLMCTERGQEELERTARLDFLTGIFNRRAIEDLASRAISAARRHGTPLAIMILDLDHFKRINDAHGHEVGDHALLETVRRMREAMRAEDLVGRLGGEEFVAVMPDMDLDSAYAAAERLRRNFSDRPMFIYSGGERIEIMVTVSIGVTVLQSDDRLFSHLLRRADQAMYAAKAGGRNLVMLDGGPR